MFQFVRDPAAQTATARFGNATLGNGTQHPLPATAPAPRARYEARALVDLARGGAEIPSLSVSITRRAPLRAELGALIGGSRTMSLDDFVRPLSRPLVVPDLETEALSTACKARELISKETGIPKSISELLECGLTGDRKTGRLESGSAWDKVRREYGLASLRGWYERVQAECGSEIFFAPSPLVRASIHSVDRAFEYGWHMADTVQDPTFRGRGVHFLIHSEFVLDNRDATVGRLQFQANLRKMATGAAPRNAPFVSIKEAVQVTDWPA